jgi:hypothetical protein
MIVNLYEYAALHQKEMRREAEGRRLEREFLETRQESHVGKVLVPAGNGTFQWSTVRDRAA